MGLDKDSPNETPNDTNSPVAADKNKLLPAEKKDEAPDAQVEVEKDMEFHGDAKWKAGVQGVKAEDWKPSCMGMFLAFGIIFAVLAAGFIAVAIISSEDVNEWQVHNWYRTHQSNEHGPIAGTNIAPMASRIRVILRTVKAKVNNALADTTYPRYILDFTHPDLPLPALFTACAGAMLALCYCSFACWTLLKNPVPVDFTKGKPGSKKHQKLQDAALKMACVADRIKLGATAFLRQEYLYLSIFVFVFFWLQFACDYDEGGWKTGICFIVGAATSAFCGFFGMMIATSSNIRTTIACHPGFDEAFGETKAWDPSDMYPRLSRGLRVAFTAGSIMGMSVVGAGLLMVVIMFFVFRDVKFLAGFSFGASSIALFARVGGGIFTKAADVGADLVGKVEKDIPEDDPRNAGTIADNVGDNVGDVAGMGADLFESFVGSIIAAATLGGKPYGIDGIAAPFYMAAGGIVCSIIGTFVVRSSEKDPKKIGSALLHALHRGVYLAAILNVGVAAIICFTLSLDWQVFLSFVIGLLAGIGIGFSTEIATSTEYSPTRKIAEQAITGPATVVVKGLSVGMMSAVPPVLIVFLSIILTVLLGEHANRGYKNFHGLQMVNGAIDMPSNFHRGAGEYCVAIAGVGMLSTLGITLATDAYGPVADNAGGIAEMVELGSDEVYNEDGTIDTIGEGELKENRTYDCVRLTTDALDALGNTTAATGKGFAIGSAALTAFALMRAFIQTVMNHKYEKDRPVGGILDLSGLPAADNMIRAKGEEVFWGIDPKLLPEYTVNLLDKRVISGILVGSCLPFVFAALTMDAVNEAAGSIIAIVRKDFQNEKIFPKNGEEPTELPDPAECVEVCTKASLQKMILPGLLAVLTPIIVGLCAGPLMLSGLLMGSLSTGFLLAVTMSNAGGAWDNAKKYTEAEELTWKRKNWVKSDSAGETFDKYILKKAELNGTKKAFYWVLKEKFDEKKNANETAKIVVSSKEMVQQLHQKQADRTAEEVKKEEESGIPDLVVPMDSQNGNDAKAAVVVGDTVGDPFKDTSGPALNILIKLMSIIALVIAPAIKTICESTGDFIWESHCFRNYA